MSDEFAASSAMLAGRRYVLSSLVPFHRDSKGDVWIGDLWHRDLMTHLKYIPNMVILAAQMPRPEDDDLVRVEPCEGQTIEFAANGAYLTSRKQLPRAIPGMVRAMRQALVGAEVVHGGAAGWPIPPGLLLNPMAVRRKIPFVFTIESAFWRVPEGEKASLRWKAEAAATERLARWSAAHAVLGIYTHRSYAATMPCAPGAISAVSPASWIMESDVITPAAIDTVWQAKPERLRLLLASRLIVEKGAGVLLAALKTLDSRGIGLDLDVVGSGPLAGAFADFAARSSHVTLRMLKQVSYATEFLPLLRGYHAVLVPTTGDEQPRIILDSFSQAVPVIASDTPGNREVATPDNAIFVERGNEQAWANALADPGLTPDHLRALAGPARDKAAACTHEMMHRQRAGLLVKALDGKLRPRA